ncbi:molecular chaperone (small heat shock protein) [Synechococcus sp. PCC 7502]|uniref:Hsp20/alpha crystallin family protein n=1 Tax=Synechococcus sp. PCC 7502 TaxID=1173263 RepID=UPI00029FFBFA|nr:Hsp20/alpha crystallin family protein [Synechococcus sp. PCC 7502]AFY74118.1 molecular chaperone (small heat shock protein) [Synechococcus sp. PCC 7502]
MTIIRWQPLREIDALQREMNRLFEGLTPITENAASNNFVPSVELEEDTDVIHLKLEVPGLEAKDLDVQVTAESVSINGERKFERTASENGITRSEFRYGKFQRVIPLPSRVQNTATQAEYKDGILRLTLPKAEDEKNKIFKVSLGN